MRFRSLLAAAIAVVLPLGVIAITSAPSRSAGAVAVAPVVYAFTITGPNFVASGTLNCTANGDGTYTATSGTGKVTGTLPPYEMGALTLVPNPRGKGYSYYKNSGVNYDDQLDPGAANQLDFFGLLFTLPDGDIFNIFSLGSGNYGALEVSGSTWLFYDYDDIGVAFTPAP